MLQNFPQRVAVLGSRVLAGAGGDPSQAPPQQNAGGWRELGHWPNMPTSHSLTLHLFFLADDLEGCHLLGAIAIFPDTFPNLTRIKEGFLGSAREYWGANSFQGAESSYCQHPMLATALRSSANALGMPHVEGGQPGVCTWWD